MGWRNTFTVWEICLVAFFRHKREREKKKDTVDPNLKMCSNQHPSDLLINILSCLTMSNPFSYSSSSLLLFLSHIPSILFGPPWQGQECFYSDFSCRVAYYLSLWGTSDTQACLGANSLCQSSSSSPSSHPVLLLLSTLLFFPRVLGQATHCLPAPCFEWKRPFKIH